jgi:crossover junction endodeoxyribonuclease RusA
MHEAITFVVTGRPAAQGSKRHLGKGVMVESSRYIHPWRADVKMAAMESTPLNWNQDAPFNLTITFLLARPKGHYSVKGLKSSAPATPSGRVGDLDKLLRSTLDAMTGIVFADDCQVVTMFAAKRYAMPGEQTGAIITAIPLAI